jgi:hypothetical protein
MVGLALFSLREPRRQFMLNEHNRNFRSARCARSSFPGPAEGIEERQPMGSKALLTKRRERDAKMPIRDASALGAEKPVNSRPCSDSTAH